ncbi:MAG: large conductance mechanosensitive channel protein MscL [Lachnospiraceae bacterium]|nr:large conductance mechanosensitive channel protein MscL [Lachnospiraceae bacterium]MBR5765162.1 large conductance mechanosensitive channel protein MscL [Lachnospiraceae bacterium]MBR6486773.1 large conductance mechanosensitive channel protein MscL [Lachnospiraceae bacterium]
MKSFIKEFKEFISKGNVMDMAVGVIIGGAFTAIVTSLVDDIIMPLISLLTGGFDFSNLSIALGSGEGAATFNYGAFITAIINFLLIAIVIFSIIKAINKFNKKKDAEPDPTTKVCPFCQSEISIKATKCPHCTSDLDK